MNVSCRGGTRVEIKGVAHTRWMPELTHNESFRQWALVHIIGLLNEKISEPDKWNLNYVKLERGNFDFSYEPLQLAKNNNLELIAIHLPGFRGILSHFTQPGQSIADEISTRLKVIACIEKPNMINSEEMENHVSEAEAEKISKLLGCKDDSAWIVLWGENADIPTAIETVEERCRMAFKCIPNETRKSLEDGTTIFERVLPGADRMYPDTDSAPIPLKNEQIEGMRKKIPADIFDRIQQLNAWKVPQSTYTFLLKKNLLPLIEKIESELNISPRFTGTFLGQSMKFVENNYHGNDTFTYQKIFDLFKFLKDKNIHLNIAQKMLPHFYMDSSMDFDSILSKVNFKLITKDEIIKMIPSLRERFNQIKVTKNPEAENRWVIGEVSKLAMGNMDVGGFIDFVSESRKRVGSN